jgi:hypothetical protein
MRLLAEPLPIGHVRVSEPELGAILKEQRCYYSGALAEHIDLTLVRRLTAPEVEELVQHVMHPRFRVLR